MKILKFYSRSCVPCKMMDPLLDKLSSEFGIEVENINISETDLVIKYEIRSVPTLILIDDNEEEIRKLIGSVPYSQLIEFINVESN